MNERIKKMRKALDLTQQEFANRIGSVQNTITGYETGRRVPSSQVITLICKTFNVNEEWLRTGSGEMFKQTEESAVSRLCAELNASDLEAGIIRAYFRIDPQIRESFMHHLLKEVQAEYSVSDQEPDTPPAAAELTLEQEADQFAAMAREQFLSEKLRESQVLSAKESDAG